MPPVLVKETVDAPKDKYIKTVQNLDEEKKVLADLKARDSSYKTDYDNYIEQDYFLDFIPVVPNGTRLVSSIKHLNIGTVYDPTSLTSYSTKPSLYSQAKWTHSTKYAVREKRLAVNFRIFNSASIK